MTAAKIVKNAVIGPMVPWRCILAALAGLGEKRENGLETFDFRKIIWYPLTGTLAMGFAGFICGYFGPLILNPDGNLGPLLGIFTTGPLGALIGALIGAGGALARLRPAMFTMLTAACTSLVAGATLYAALPEDRWEGIIIDASIRGCSAPDTLADGAIAKWDEWNAAPGHTPRPDWKEDVASMLERDRGVVLTMFVYRKRDVFKQRTPWNRDVLRATPWKENARMEVFFDRRTQGSCSAYPLGQAAFYSTDWEASGVSPPNVASSFLGLSVLRDVPATFQEFVRGQKPVS